MKARLRHPAAPGADAHEDAARWALRQHDQPPLDAAAATALEHWRTADAAQAQALDDALRALRLLDRAAGTPDIAAMRADALSARPERRAGRHWPLAGLGALVLAVAATWLGSARIPAPADSAPDAAALGSPAAGRYLTGIGERSTISLPDGSVAILNTDTALDVAYTGAERTVRLLRGQAIFQVAKEAGRPFRVLAAGKRITAVGTEFDVRIDHARLQVALLHGVVKVDGADTGGAASAQMVAGDVLDVVDEHQMRVTRGDPQRISGWRDGQVVFDDESLANAVAEMNRYSTRPIRIDPRIAQRYYVSGVFKTGDTDRFAQALVESFPLALAHDDAGHPLIGPSDLTKDSQ